MRLTHCIYGPYTVSILIVNLHINIFLKMCRILSFDLKPEVYVIVKKCRKLFQIIIRFELIVQ